MIPIDLNSGKRRLKSNNPTRQPGKISMLMGGNFWMVIDTHKSLNQDHAASTPNATQPINRHCLDLSRVNNSTRF